MLLQQRPFRTGSRSLPCSRTPTFVPKGLADLSHDVIEAALTPVGAAPGNLSTFWKLLVKEAKENPPFIPQEQQILDDFVTTTGVALDGSNLLGLEPEHKASIEPGADGWPAVHEWLSSTRQTGCLLPDGWSAPATKLSWTKPLDI
eukprot:jgi/Botrbrau1/8323/Bobra.0081s0012.1